MLGSSLNYTSWFHRAPTCYHWEMFTAFQPKVLHSVRIYMVLGHD